MRAPTFPDTRPGAPVMPGGQVRYFSLCQNEFASQRFIACRTDDQTAVGPDGFMTYVVSTPAQRPSNARAPAASRGCRAARARRPPDLPPHAARPVRRQAIQRIGTRAAEGTAMGDYFPRSRCSPTARRSRRSVAPERVGALPQAGPPAPAGCRSAPDGWSPAEAALRVPGTTVPAAGGRRDGALRRAARAHRAPRARSAAQGAPHARSAQGPGNAARFTPERWSVRAAAGTARSRFAG